jgi:hypothetical protein
MARGPLYQQDYRPQFSGHETFPLRYGWLKKTFDAIYASENQPENKSVFLGDDAIARFGVGKNMVASMRHWAGAAGIIMEESGSNVIRTTEFGSKLFGPDGLDPYMEHPASLWLMHWHLSGHPEKTTWFWAFNHFPDSMFERDSLVKGLEKLAADRAWSRVAGATIKRDVECFVRTYVARLSSGHASHEDTLESPLTELGLIKAIGRRDGFRFVRGPKSSLGEGVFLYALIDFWGRHSKAQTLSFEAIAHEPGSPGQVFLLDENDIAERLLSLDEVTGGAFRWSETAGLKQILREAEPAADEAFRFIERDYEVVDRREVA